jgi:predicted Ser/Thr protein kinase
MNAERYARVADAFKAVYRRAPHERDSALSEACGGDPLLYQEVLGLLREHDELTTLLNTGAIPRVAPRAAENSSSVALSPEAQDLVTGPRRPDSHELPERIGHYRILGVLGVGGMGIVYRAEQSNPIRPVALKVIKAGIASPDTRRRFEHEAQILARLQHPGIAQIFEAGTARYGPIEQPFFAMELVTGARITEFARAAGLDGRRRLEMIAEICDAVQHAHQKGIIHRDLKPSNILVDERGRPRILDFGVARLTDADREAATQPTDVGQLVGTIPYMSPEQMAGDPQDVDTRSDVYALGILTFELLAGRPPYDVRGVPIPEAIRIVREREPARLGAIDRFYRGDPETIVAKALEKDKNRRYSSASGLAADIRRFLRDEPVSARPATTLYQLQKLARRNRALFTGAAVAAAALMLGFTGTTIGLLRARSAEANALRAAARAEEQKELAEREARKALQVQEFLEYMLASADPYVSVPKRSDFTVRELLDAAAEKLETEFGDEPEVKATLLQTLGNSYSGLGLHEPAMKLLAESVRVHREITHDELALADALADLALAAPRRASAASRAIAQLDEAIEIWRRLRGPDYKPIVDAKRVQAILAWERGGRDETWERIIDAAVPLLTLLNEEAFAEPVRSVVAEARRLARGGDRAQLGEYLHQYRVEAAEQLVRLWASGERDAARAFMRAHYAPLLDIPYFRSRVPGMLVSEGIWLSSEGAPLELAEPILREGLDLARELHQTDPERVDEWDIAYAQRELALLLRLNGKLDEARSLLDDSVALQRSVAPDDHPELATNQLLLGLVLLDRGDAPAAEPFLRQALETRRSKFTADDWQWAEAESAYGACLTALGRHEEAEPLLIRSFPIIREQRSGRDHRAREAAERLVRFCEATGRSAEAEEYRRIASEER